MADVTDVEKQETEEKKSLVARRRTYFREHPLAKWVLLLLVVAAAYAGIRILSYYEIRETTDDAQIDGHINPIAARVGGTVLVVSVDDNQFVEEGRVLVQIDPSDYQVALDHARADLAAEQAAAQAAERNVSIVATNTSSTLSTADAGVEAARAALAAAQKEVEASHAQVAAADAKVREAEAKDTQAQSDLARMKQLIAKDEISQQQYDAAVATAGAKRATVDSTRAAVANTQQKVAVAESHVAQARAALLQAEAAVLSAHTAPQEVASSQARLSNAQAKILQAEANVSQAQLNLQYTTVRAPVRGFISEKTVEVGQVIVQGQPLLAVVPLEDIWVTANFKETQLNHMRQGQPAIVAVDAFGGRQFRGHVDSIAAATGARFSLLPPENATGNYVKVVQRIPVKIVFEKGEDPNHLLRPGMSVETTVITR
jgi:membrane fusion protein (multidrug efflux system)